MNARRWTYGLPIAVLISGILLSLLGWRVTNGLVRDRMQSEFFQRSHSLHSAIQSGIRESMQSLKSNARTLAQFDSLGKEDFSALAAKILAESPELQAIEWVPRVPHRLREAYEQAARAQGFRDFSFKDKDDSGRFFPVGKQEIYYPIYFVEPLEGNEEALGYCTGPPVRKEIIDQALATGEAVASDLVPLVQSDGKPHGLLVFCPVWNSASRPDRDPQSARGLLEAVYKVDDLLATILEGQDREGIDLSFTSSDGKRTAGIPVPHDELELAEYSPRERALRLEAGHTRAIVWGQRHFKLTFKPTAGFSRQYPLYVGTLMLALGLAFTVVCSLFLFFYLGQNTRIRRQVEKQTRELVQGTRELKQALEHKDAARAELRLMAHTLEQITEAVLVSDPKGNLYYMNPAAEKLFGRTLRESPDLKEEELLDPKAMKSLDKQTEPEKASEVLRAGETLLKPAGGREFLAQIVVSRMQNSETGDPLTVSLVRDVSEQRSTEKKLYHAQKVEAVGMLAGGIAHDFNNVLTAINGSCQILQLKLKDEGNRRLVDDVLRTAERAATMVKQLLAFGRSQQGKRESLDLNEVARSMNSMLDRLVPKHIRLSFESHPDLPPVLAERSKLEQLLLNLILNARDAIEGEGWIRVITEEPHQGVRLPDAASAAVRLRVMDNGCGIPADMLEKIFEPFFTTKKDKGTGMGLATVSNIVRTSLRGSIQVDSRVGLGTEFIIDLPALPRPGRTAQRDPSGTPKQMPRILVVEDEKDVRELIHQVLAGAGFDTNQAESAEQALRILERAQFDLLLTDIVMPGKNGVELGREVSPLYPEMKILYMSAFANESLDSGNAFRTEQFIQKPFLPSVLTGMVRQLLELDETNPA